MIEVLSFNKSNEGLLYKSSQIRYVWSIKVNEIRHIIEFIEGSFGKKLLMLDQKEIYNDRSVLSSHFNFKFLVDNIILILRKDQEEYDIFLEEDQSKSFKTILNESKMKKVVAPQPMPEYESALPGIQYSDNSNQFSNKMSNRNTAQQKNAFLAFDFNTSNTKKTEADFNVPDFGFSDNTVNQVPEPKQNTNHFDDDSNDYSFKNVAPRRMSQNTELNVFDGYQQENKTIETNGFFEDTSESNKNEMLVSKPAQGYLVKDQELSNDSNTIDPTTFDADLERSKKVNKGGYRSPFDLDAEETAETIGRGFKSVFKKIKKTVNTLE